MRDAKLVPQPGTPTGHQPLSGLILQALPFYSAWILGSFDFHSWTSGGLLLVAAGSVYGIAGGQCPPLFTHV